MNYEDAAAYLNIAKGTLYAFVSQKRIPHIRLGSRVVRFRKEDLDAWLDSMHVPVGADT